MAWRALWEILEKAPNEIEHENGAHYQTLTIRGMFLPWESALNVTIQTLFVPLVM